MPVICEDLFHVTGEMFRVKDSLISNGGSIIDLDERDLSYTSWAKIETKLKVGSIPGGLSHLYSPAVPSVKIAASDKKTTEYVRKTLEAMGLKED